MLLCSRQYVHVSQSSAMDLALTFTVLVLTNMRYARMGIPPTLPQCDGEKAPAGNIHQILRW